MVPPAQFHADQDPEWDARLEPARAFDSPDVDRAGPSELLQDPLDAFLCRRVVPGDDHLRRPARELWIDHLRVRDGVEALHDMRIREESLEAFSKGIREADEERRTPTRVPKRVRHIDDNFATEVRGTGKPDDVLERGAQGRENDDLPVLRGFGHRADRRLTFSLLLHPLLKGLALRISRSDFHIVTATHKATAERLPHFAASKDPDFHAAAMPTARISDFAAGRAGTMRPSSRGSLRFYREREVSRAHGAHPASRPGPHALEAGAPRGEGGRRRRRGLARSRDSLDQVGGD